MLKELISSFENKIDNYSHLEKIREKLLSTDGKSRVSIMVGAGFSRNAAKIEESFEGMALWSDLKLNLVKDLNNHRNIENRSVLEIGEVYSSEYGRSALDDLLKRLIPDENYEPTELYDKLLNLPWADIYTTNYDTLLERSKANIYERNYQVVYDISDIPTSVQPRIVKLHGSFPANRPFVFTKKDYDDYPVKFSPFVNMVQQSIMETTFVLIGFSGDDPNFEKWTSWVRANLKDHMPKIYMIGIDEGKREKELKDKGITLIDFKNIYHDYKGYSQMFSDLFDYLSPQKEEESTNWPFHKKIQLSQLDKLKMSYPGWIVLPDKIRRDYYESVEELISNFFKYNELNTNPFYQKKNLLIKNESMSDSQMHFDKEIIKQLINIIWFTEVFNIAISVELENVIKKAIDSKVADEKQLNVLYLTLLKGKRLENDYEGFDEYLEKIKSQPMESQNNHRCFYEVAQYFIGRNKIKEALNIIDQWDVGDREPEWGVKKACLYIKLNRVDSATKLFNKYLQTIRKLLAIKNNDYRLLSLESIILSHFRKDKGDDYAYERLKTLSLKDCYSEKEFTSTLRSVQRYNQVEYKKVDETFDLEIINTRILLGFSQDNSYCRYESFAISQMNEQYHFERNMSENDLDQLIVALENLKHMYKFYSYKTLILRNDRKILSKLIKRASVVYMKQDIKDILLDLLEPTLTFDDEKSLIDNVNALDLYSRLYMILSESEKEIVYQKVLEAVQKINYSKFSSIHKIVRLAFKRMIINLNEKEVKGLIEKLNDFEIPEDIDSIVPFKLFDPMDVLFRLKSSETKKLKINPITITYLLNKLERSEKIEVLVIVLRRLICFIEFKKITESSKRKLTSIINEMDDDKLSKIREYISLKKYKQPDGYNFLNDNDNDNLFFEKYLSKDIPNFYEKKGNEKIYYSGDSTLAYFRRTVAFFGHYEEIIKTKIRKKEHYHKWLDKLFKWWSNNKEALLAQTDTRVLSFVEVDDILEEMMDALKNSILSTIPLEYLRTSDKIQLRNLFNDLLEDDKPHALIMIPLLDRLKLGHNNKDHNIEFFKETLAGFSGIESKINGLNSLYFYVVFFNKSEIDLSKDEFRLILDELVNAINYSEGKVLEEALYVFSEIVDLVPELMEDRYIIFSVQYLNAYLKKLNDEIKRSPETLAELNNFELRLLSSRAKLASILIKYSKQSEISDGSMLEEWEEFIMTHPLPEVRDNKDNFYNFEVQF